MRSFLFLVIFVNHVSAQHPDDKFILDKLCSKDLAGRGYVDYGDALAANFIASQFKRMGLKKVKRSFFQSFDFQVNTFPDSLFLKINGNFLEAGLHYVVNPSSPSGTFTRESYVFNQSFSNIDDLFDKIKNIDRTNQILVFDKGAFKSKEAMTNLQSAVTKISDFMPVLLLNDGPPIWHVSQYQMRFPVFEVDKKMFENGRIEMKVVAKLINHKTRNVIARIPAKNKAKRRIVFTAHYDHLGKMGNFVFYPGANDNASGVTLMLAITRKLFAKPRTDTEYVFIAFAGEEVGLLGSKHFVSNPLIDLNSIRFLLNLDIFGGAHHSITAVNGTIYSHEFQCLHETNQEMNITPEIKARGESPNSDHHWFHKAGVRSMFLYSGGLNAHYHVPWDEAKDVDLVLLDKTADLIVRFILKL